MKIYNHMTKSLKEGESPLSSSSNVCRTLQKKPQIFNGINQQIKNEYFVVDCLRLLNLNCWLPFPYDIHVSLAEWKRWGPLFQRRSWSTRRIQLTFCNCLNKRQLNVCFKVMMLLYWIFLSIKQKKATF